MDGRRGKENICIYVLTHKLYSVPSSDPIYKTLLAGENVQNAPGGWLRDNTGDSISHKNSRYNELTGLYWIWKNSDYDIVGLCHYRRFFVTYKGKIRNLVSGRISGLIDREYILRNLCRHDIILHNKTFFKEGNRTQLALKRGMSLVEDGKVSSEILDLAEKVFEQIYPEDIDVYRRVMKNHCAHLLNVMIARKDIIDRYCEWLFGLLFKIEAQIDMKYPERKLPRIMGLIAERLLDVWVIRENLRVKECFTVNTEKIDKSWIAR